MPSRIKEIKKRQRTNKIKQYKASFKNVLDIMIKPSPKKRRKRSRC